MKKKVLKIIGYKNQYGDHNARLDMRIACKNDRRAASTYFTKTENPYADNIGKIAFGVPDKWKGVVGIEYEPLNPNREIVFYIDRTRCSEYVGEIASMLQLGAVKMRMDGVIDDFEVFE